MTVACVVLPLDVAGVVVSDRGERYLPGCLHDLWGQGWEPHVVDDSKHELGMAGAVRAAWEWALDTGCDGVLHVEEDFRFPHPIPLGGMGSILFRNPHLAQVVLKRQPWSPQEVAAGGIIEANPDAYTECHRGERSWCEHTEIFSLNPCLIPRRVLELGWPDGNEAEFTQKCLDAGYRFAFYGRKFDPPLVEHIGYQRGEGWRL